MAFSNKWINILNRVDDICSQIRMPWFRGHSNTDYQLSSGLFRNRNSHEISTIINHERAYYREFLHNGHAHHSQTDWNLLYLMQHHGVSTRLLDWTESFSVALYFAFKDWDSHNNACVWILDPFELNLKTKNNQLYYIPYEGAPYEDFLYKDESFFEYSVALFPIRNSNRLIAQQGVFTLQGNKGVPLDQEHYGRLVKEDALVKIELTQDIKDDVGDFLYLSGVTEHTLFPDMDGLSRSMKKDRAYSTSRVIYSDTK